MGREILKAGGVVLPAPVSITVNDEIIWSADTGRTMSGQMVGEAVAEKKNVGIKWGCLIEGDMMQIRRYLVPGFFSVSFRDDGVMLAIESYRGTLSKEQLGWLGGEFWYRSVSVDIIQR